MKPIEGRIISVESKTPLFAYDKITIFNEVTKEKEILLCDSAYLTNRTCTIFIGIKMYKFNRKQKIRFYGAKEFFGKETLFLIKHLENA